MFFMLSLKKSHLRLNRFIFLHILYNGDFIKVFDWAVWILNVAICLVLMRGVLKSKQYNIYVQLILLWITLYTNLMPSKARLDCKDLSCMSLSSRKWSYPCGGYTLFIVKYIYFKYFLCTRSILLISVLYNC